MGSPKRYHWMALLLGLDTDSVRASVAQQACTLPAVVITGVAGCRWALKYMVYKKVEPSLWVTVMVAFGSLIVACVTVMEVASGERLVALTCGKSLSEV